MSEGIEETSRSPGLAVGRWVAFAAWAAALWILSSRSKLPHTGLEFPHFDKVAHFCYFGLGAVLLGAAAHRAGLSPTVRLLLVAMAVMAALGMLDEYHQSFVPGRSGNDFGDWIADVSGSAVALLVWRSWSRRRRKIG